MPISSARAAAGLPMPNLLAIDRALPVVPRSTPNRASRKIALPLAVEAAQPDDFALGDREKRCRAACRSSQLAAFQHRCGASDPLRASAERHCDIRGRSSFRPLHCRCCSGLVAGNVAAVAEHGAFVGQFGDLVHAVRDVEQGHAFRAQTLQHGEDALDVAGGQGRRRFVEDQDAGFPRQRLGDFDKLPPRKRQILDQRTRVDVAGAGARQRLLGDAPLRPAVDQAEATRWGGDRDIVRDAQIGDQRKLLKDAGDACGGGLCRRAKLNFAPSSSRRPSSGATTPAMILMSVDLPAPFSPRMAWMRPARTTARRYPAPARRHSASRRRPSERSGGSPDHGAHVLPREG